MFFCRRKENVDARFCCFFHGATGAVPSSKRENDCAFYALKKERRYVHNESSKRPFSRFDGMS